mgnify:CR=1 FL=1
MNPQTRDRLRNFIERVERVEEERKALTTDIADILKQAKGEGFDPKVMRQVLKLRKLSAAERQEADALLEVYMRAVTDQLEMFEEAA